MWVMRVVWPKAKWQLALVGQFLQSLVAAQEIPYVNAVCAVVAVTRVVSRGREPSVMDWRMAARQST